MDNLSFEAMKSLDPTFAVAHKIATAGALIVVSLVLTALFSLIALVGGWLVRRLRRAAGRLVNPSRSNVSPLRRSP
jgi:flagellar biogenesis protein FliO